MAAAITAGGLANVAMIAQQQFATGTGYAPGGMAMVGETGAEMVNLPRGSSVTNNMHTNSTSNSNVTVNVLGSNGRVVESLRASLRSGSGDSLVRDLKAALA
jgi:phage-related tail protein